jgi:hypothetical protein
VISPDCVYCDGIGTDKWCDHIMECQYCGGTGGASFDAPDDEEEQQPPNVRERSDGRAPRAKVVVHHAEMWVQAHFLQSSIGSKRSIVKRGIRAFL